MSSRRNERARVFRTFLLKSGVRSTGKPWYVGIFRFLHYNRGFTKLPKLKTKAFVQDRYLNHSF